MEVFSPLIPDYTSSNAAGAGAERRPDGFTTCGDTSCGAAVNSFGEFRIFEEAAAPASFARER